MNKKLMIAIASLVGFITIFMPWFRFESYYWNAINEYFNDGYIFGFLYAVILITSLIQPVQEKSKQRQTLIIMILGTILFVFSITDVIVNKDILDSGGALAIGAYLSILSSGFIAVYTYYFRKNSDDNSELSINQEKIIEATKKGVAVAQTFTKIAGKAAKAAIADVKKGMQEKDTQEKDTQSKDVQGNNSQENNS